MGKGLVQLINDISVLPDKNGKNRAPEIMENLNQLAQLLSGNLTARNIKNGSITPELLSKDFPPFLRMAQGQYKGDGTANRTITVEDELGPFTPTEVSVLNIQTVNEFFSRDDGVSTVSWYRLASGSANGDPQQWQGIVPGGFRAGISTAALSNTSGQDYSWVALRRG